LANIAGLYAVWHGPKGLTAIARRIYAHAVRLERGLSSLGIRQLNDSFFDTLCLQVPPGAADRIHERAVAAQMNFRFRDDGTISVALDETTEVEDVAAIAAAFAEGMGRRGPAVQSFGANVDAAYAPSLARSSPFLMHPVFNAHHSETQMMRYIRTLERKDIGLDTSMIPLGSCTMKLNAASEMLPITWTEFSRIPPSASLEQTAGYQQIFRELEAALCAITGLRAVSLQPNSGAQGEFAGLMVIRAYHRSRGEGDRDVVLIPSSAHGT